MSATYLLTTELPVQADRADEAVDAWSELLAAAADKDRALYRCLEANTLLELRALTGLDEIAAADADFEPQWNTVGPYAAGDFRRQALRFVEAPKEPGTALPVTPYVQLRYVEVKPQAYEAYRAWREATVFDVVRDAEEVESFSTYHTVVSTQPGVLFLSGFSCAPEQYQRPFSSDRFTEMVQQAGDRYFAGGPGGLQTRCYERVDA
ncbi:hypothetical protein [Glycomyces algeriensis]|uniref:Uncharacterized protein n=1 Tax=Glycomyces algeriensis TaxID=256037 RepID=A0A9W6GCX8_9ACTN|nr:hypothetical protein [Glycomyces algeriensis]MDA1368296.1 hypothetical protein [Glycomyces algeriensis]MDR7351737.1 hypothetical protein [Glycomyces algeriensis]GLI44463.1 hypothetical protein GALLR39Z86_43130 [Glycomyces algeriensis]